MTSSSSLAVLRQRLGATCVELRFLTTEDLAELKWKTKQAIFEGLFKLLDARLSDQHEDLQRLLEGRSLEIKRQRASGAGEPREARIESEQLFRSRFAGIILTGLEKLQWPPCLAAFANPLQDLISDAGTFIDAATFLLNLVAPIYREPTTRIHTPSSSSPAAQSPSPGISMVEASPPPSPSSLHLSLLPVTARAEAKDSSLLSARSTKSTKSAKASNFSPPDDFDLSRMSTAYSQFRGGGSDAGYNETNIGDEPLLTTISILQHHNEMLSKQLKHLQESVCARDQAEARMDSVLQDLKAAIDEVANTAAGGGGAKSGCGSAGTASHLLTSPFLDLDPAEVTQEEDELFRAEVNREAAAAEAKRRVTSGLITGAGRGKGVQTGRKEFEDIQRSKLPSSQTPRDQRVNTASSIVWSKLQGRVQAICGQWDEARREARGAINKPVQMQRESASFLSAKKFLPSDVRIHQVLGVRPPLSLLAPRDRLNFDPANEHFLDIARIHLLQRDLVAFAESAFVSTNRRRNASAQAQNRHSRPTSSSSSSSWQAHANEMHSIFNEDSLLDDDISTIHGDAHAVLDKLCLHARDLVLHLACFVPLAPLAVDSPYASSLTGLEALIKEAEGLLKSTPAKNSKAFSMSLQVAADRAKSEQLTLIRVATAAKESLSTESDVTKRRNMAVNRFVKEAGVILARPLTEMKKHLEAISAVTIAIEAAEKSRGPGGREKPLESIARGSLGTDVAALVSSLRIHRDDLEALREKMESLSGRVKSELSSALRACTESCV